MTRYARAKGSKASNEKLPEDPTSWSMMKQQLLEKTRNIEENQRYLKVQNQRNANYKKFLAEREAEESKNVKWADFPGASIINPVKKNENKTKKLKIQAKQTLASELSDDDDSDETFLELKEKIDKVLEEQQDGSESDAAPEELSSKTEVKAPVVPKAKKLKVKKLKIVSDKESKVVLKKGQAVNATGGHVKKSKSTGDTNIENNEDETNIANNLLEKEKIVSELDLKRIQKKKERRLKQVKKKQAMKLQMKDSNMNKKDEENRDQETFVPQRKNEGVKELKSKSDLSEPELRRIQKKKEKKLRQLEKRKLKKKMEKENKETEGKLVGNGLDARRNEDETNDHITSNHESKNKVIKNDFEKGNNGDKKNNDQGCSDNRNISNSKIKSPNKQESTPKKRKNKSTDVKEHQRKKPQLPEKMWINGEQVEIGYVDGFPIMKKDAERLKKLKKDMVMKGLPGSEIKAALKLERRRSEKALAREKKKVCFNCRKSGHNLSECPQLGKDQMISTAGSGICFKCGSTEHSHLDCKVVKGQSFNYAQCFICNEQGHIARQCPDNPKGLYPKGGGCNVCGDVSHLKKDCPTYQEQQQKQNEVFKVGTLGTSNPDADDDHDNTHKVENTNSYRPNKIIKF